MPMPIPFAVGVKLQDRAVDDLPGSTVDVASIVARRDAVTEGVHVLDARAQISLPSGFGATLDDTVATGIKSGHGSPQGTVVAWGSGYLYMQDDATSGNPSLWVSTGVGYNWLPLSSARLSNTKSWDPGTVSSGSFATTTVSVTGAAVGDTVAAAFTPAVPAGVLVSGSVTGTGTVTVTLLNQSGSSYAPGAGTLRADVWHTSP